MNKEKHLHSNPCLEEKWKRENRHWHKRMVQGAKSPMQQYFSESDNRKETRYNSVSRAIRNNAKKELQDEIRATEIERQNRILVEKMTDIIRGKGKGPLNGLGTHDGLARLSNEPLSKSLANPNFTKLKAQQQGSNQSQVREQQRQLRESNEKLLQRLQDAKSSYDVDQWQADRLKNIKVIGMRTKYDYKWLTKNEIKGLRSDMHSQRTYYQPRNRYGPASSLTKKSDQVLSQYKLIKPERYSSHRKDKISRFLEKSFTRYDEDYKVDKLYKLKDQFIEQEEEDGEYPLLTGRSHNSALGSSPKHQSSRGVLGLRFSRSGSKKRIDPMSDMLRRIQKTQMDQDPYKQEMLQEVLLAKFQKFLKQEGDHDLLNSFSGKRNLLGKQPKKREPSPGLASMKKLIDHCQENPNVDDDTLAELREEYNLQKQIGKLLKTRKRKKSGWYNQGPIDQSLIAFKSKQSIQSGRDSLDRSSHYYPGSSTERKVPASVPEEAGPNEQDGGTGAKVDMFGHALKNDGRVAQSQIQILPTQQSEIKLKSTERSPRRQDFDSHRMLGKNLTSIQSDNRAGSILLGTDFPEGKQIQVVDSRLKIGSNSITNSPGRQTKLSMARIDEIFTRKKKGKGRVDRIPFSTLAHCPEPVPNDRTIIHTQQIVIAYRAIFDVELSFENKKFYILIKRRFGKGLEALGKQRVESMSREQKKAIKKEMKRQMREFRGSSEASEARTQPKGALKMFCKSLYITQAKQLIRLFNADLTAMVNGLIKINENFNVDFSFIDKVLTHLVGIEKNELLSALKLVDAPPQAQNNSGSETVMALPTEISTVKDSTLRGVVLHTENQDISIKEDLGENTIFDNSNQNSKYPMHVSHSNEVKPRNGEKLKLESGSSVPKDIFTSSNNHTNMSHETFDLKGEVLKKPLPNAQIQMIKETPHFNRNELRFNSTKNNTSGDHHGEETAGKSQLTLGQASTSKQYVKASPKQIIKKPSGPSAEKQRGPSPSKAGPSLKQPVTAKNSSNPGAKNLIGKQILTSRNMGQASNSQQVAKAISSTKATKPGSKEANTPNVNKTLFKDTSHPKSEAAAKKAKSGSDKQSEKPSTTLKKKSSNQSKQSRVKKDDKDQDVVALLKDSEHPVVKNEAGPGKSLSEWNNDEQMADWKTPGKTQAKKEVEYVDFTVDDANSEEPPKRVTDQEVKQKLMKGSHRPKQSEVSEVTSGLKEGGHEIYEDDDDYSMQKGHIEILNRNLKQKAISHRRVGSVVEPRRSPSPNKTQAVVMEISIQDMNRIDQGSKIEIESPNVQLATKEMGSRKGSGSTVHFVGPPSRKEESRPDSKRSSKILFMGSPTGQVEVQEMPPAEKKETAEASSKPSSKGAAPRKSEAPKAPTASGASAPKTSVEQSVASLKAASRKTASIKPSQLSSAVKNTTAPKPTAKESAKPQVLNSPKEAPKTNRPPSLPPSSATAVAASKQANQSSTKAVPRSSIASKALREEPSSSLKIISRKSSLRPAAPGASLSNNTAPRPSKAPVAPEKILTSPKQASPEKQNSLKKPSQFSQSRNPSMKAVTEKQPSTKSEQDKVPSPPESVQRPSTNQKTESKKSNSQKSTTEARKSEASAISKPSSLGEKQLSEEQKKEPSKKAAGSAPGSHEGETAILSSKSARQSIKGSVKSSPSVGPSPPAPKEEPVEPEGRSSKSSVKPDEVKTEAIQKEPKKSVISPAVSLKADDVPSQVEEEDFEEEYESEEDDMEKKPSAKAGKTSSLKEPEVAIPVLSSKPASTEAPVAPKANQLAKPEEAIPKKSSPIAKKEPESKKAPEVNSSEVKPSVQSSAPPSKPEEVKTVVEYEPGMSLKKEKSVDPGHAQAKAPASQSEPAPAKEVAEDRALSKQEEEGQPSSSDEAQEAEVVKVQETNQQLKAKLIISEADAPQRVQSSTGGPANVASENEDDDDDDDDDDDEEEEDDEDEEEESSEEEQPPVPRQKPYVLASNAAPTSLPPLVSASSVPVTKKEIDAGSVKKKFQDFLSKSFSFFGGSNKQEEEKKEQPRKKPTLERRFSNVSQDHDKASSKVPRSAANEQSDDEEESEEEQQQQVPQQNRPLDQAVEQVPSSSGEEYDSEDGEEEESGEYESSEAENGGPESARTADHTPAPRMAPTRT